VTGCRPGFQHCSTSLQLLAGGARLELEVAGWPPGWVPWDPRDDVFTDQYIGQDDAALEYGTYTVDLVRHFGAPGVGVQGRRVHLADGGCAKARWEDDVLYLERMLAGD